MANKYDDPRWQRKRLEIMQRDAFSCVSCGDSSSTLHVHHKRYQGELWDSPVDDLETLCESCHSALGAHPKGGIWWQRASRDSSHPATYRYLHIAHCPKCRRASLRRRVSELRCPSCSWSLTIPEGTRGVCPEGSAVIAEESPVIFGNEIKSFYLAGKITGDDWRSEIIKGYGHENQIAADLPKDPGDFWETLDKAVCVLDCHHLTYTGPWWVAPELECGHARAINHSLGPHATPHLDSHGYPVDLSGTWDKSVVCHNIRTAIKRADLVFAWINSADCYGTLFEIGYAVALGKAVVIAFHCKDGEITQEHWVSHHMADITYQATSPTMAWQRFWHDVGQGRFRDRKEWGGFHITARHAAEDRELNKLIISRRKIQGLL
jgi:hypothetical protein